MTHQHDVSVFRDDADLLLGDRWSLRAVASAFLDDVSGFLGVISVRRDDVSVLLDDASAIRRNVDLLPGDGVSVLAVVSP